MPSISVCTPRFRDRSLTFEQPLQLGNKKKKPISASETKEQLCQAIQAMPLPPEIYEGNFQLTLKTADTTDYFQKLPVEDKTKLAQIALSSEKSYNLASRLNALRIQAKKKDTAVLSTPGGPGRFHSAATESYGRLNPYDAAEILHNLNQPLSEVLNAPEANFQDYFDLQQAYRDRKYPEIQRRLENAAKQQGTTLRDLKKAFPYMPPQHSYQSVLWLLTSLHLSLKDLMSDRFSA